MANYIFGLPGDTSETIENIQIERGAVLLAGILMRHGFTRSQLYKDAKKKILNFLIVTKVILFTLMRHCLFQQILYQQKKY